MAYCGQDNLTDYLDFSTSAEAPVKAIVCPFVDGGAGMPPEVLSLLVFGGVGLGLSIRIKHPSPVLVAGILTAGIAALNAPGQGISLLGLVLFVGIGALGLYIYQRMQRSL